MNSLIPLLGLSFLGSVAGLAGGIIFLFKENWARRLAKFAVPLAAGVLLTVSFLDLLPEASEEIGIELLSKIVLGVFIILFLVERLLFRLHHHEANHESHSQEAVPLVIFGDTIHNFLDGVAIAASYVIDPSLGLLVALATFLHETPHEIADFGILLSAGWSRVKTFKANLFSSLATFPGALLTYFYASRIESATGILLGIAAGLFLYVAATDFLPDTKEKSRFSSVGIFFFIFGVILMIFFSSLLPQAAR